MQDKPSPTPNSNRCTTVHRTRLDLQCSRVASILLVGTVFAIAAVSPASAQQTIGSDICGTPLADTVNFAAPLFIGILMIASAILAYVLHNASAFPKNPQSVESIKGWRNRAAFATVTTPLFAVVIDLLIRSTGVGIAGCVNIIPFF
ncbi:hypothetical protein [Haladaptatus sp. DFWS20]|uniref:hypothetical protein n=1 Tax=Haladaptatus sp. DFWS20 TaxID=3403467 RepID=UPI003EBDC0ED